jgi:hypothetical protein
VVFHIHPVPDIFAVTVDGEFFSFQDVEDRKGNEFFRELAGAVVVGSV